MGGRKPISGAEQELFAMLRQARKGLPDTGQKEVASVIGLTVASLSAWETGRARPSVPAMTRWVRALNQSEDLVDEWLDRRVEDQMVQVLAGLKGHHAVSPDEIRVARVAIRGILAGRRERTGLRVIKGRR